MSKIRLSPKHGVNPSIPTCFWCGETKNEVILFGRLPNDQEAGMHCGVVDYVPCEKCAAQWAQGIVLIEAVTTTPADNRPQIGTGIYPTGRFAVIKTEAAERIFDAEMAAAAIQYRKAFIDSEALNMLLSPANGN